MRKCATLEAGGTSAHDALLASAGFQAGEIEALRARAKQSEEELKQAREREAQLQRAFEQAKTAALNLLDKPVAHDRVPWFWSDQFDSKLLIVGLSQDHDRQVLRGDPASRSFSVCYLKGRELLAVEAVNHSKDYMAARKLIAERALMHLDKLADSALGLKEAI